MKIRVGFGDRGTRKEDYDEYIDKWVMITHGYNDFSVGFVKEIDNNHVLKLSPYEGVRYHEEFGPMRKMIYTGDKEPVPINRIGKIEKTNLLNLEKRIKFCNEVQKKSVKKDKE